MPALQRGPQRQALGDDVLDTFSRIYDAGADEAAVYLAGLSPMGACVPAALKVVFCSAPDEQQAPTVVATNLTGLIASQQKPISEVAATKLDTKSAILEMCRKAEGLSPTQRAQLKALCLRYENVFDAGEKPLTRNKLATFSVEVPAQQRPLDCAPRPVSYAKRKIIAKVVNDGLNEGIIATSVSEWASAVVLVKKLSGEARLCVDYRPVNGVTRVPSYPLPRIHQSLDVVNGTFPYSTC